MAKTNTRKYLIYGSIAAIVGVIGYYIWKGSKKDEKPKDASTDEGLKEGNVVAETPTSNSGSGSGTSSTAPTQAQIDLAKAYRKWANSTDALSKKYGKNSKHDLDATRSDPYGGTFLASYQDGGQAEYEAYLKGNSAVGDPASGITTQNKINFNKLVASYPKGTLSQTPSGIRIWTLKFHEVVAGKTFDVWKIDLYEQTTLKDKKTQYVIKDEANRAIQKGYYSNLGKNMEATGGLHAPFKPDPQTNLAKSISAVLKMGAIQKWL
jgi:hypothetical protein